MKTGPNSSTHSLVSVPNNDIIMTQNLAFKYRRLPQLQGGNAGALSLAHRRWEVTSCVNGSASKT